MTLATVDVTLMRGGTSKGVFLRLADLPPSGPARDRFAQQLLGSPDPMQLDGLGGARSSTSKLMAVGTAAEANRIGYSVGDDIDLAYLFAQVSVADPFVDWASNCGNLTSAVGPFGLYESMVRNYDGTRPLRLFNLNTAILVSCLVAVHEGIPVTAGVFEMPGVPQPGARIDLTFHGAPNATRPVFPTGKSTEVIELDRSTSLEVTILNVDNPMIILEASAVGLRGNELPDSLNTNQDLLALVERIRGHGAVRLGLADDVRNAHLQSPGPPRVIFLSPPMDHSLVSGQPVRASQCDMLARMTSEGIFHHALAGAALTALAVAAQIDGTVVHKIAPTDTSEVRIAHAKGVVPVSALVDGEIVQSITLSRTARRLMSGTAFMPSG